MPQGCGEQVTADGLGCGLGDTELTAVQGRWWHVWVRSAARVGDRTPGGLSFPGQPDPPLAAFLDPVEWWSKFFERLKFFCTVGDDRRGERSGGPSLSKFSVELATTRPFHSRACAQKD